MNMHSGFIAQAAGHFHHWRRRAAELGPAGRAIPRHHQHAAGQRVARAALPLRCADLPEPVHWGGLSGCTYTEGVSWGKFLSREEGGQYAEVHCDATIAWPLLVRAILEERAAKGSMRPSSS